VGKTIAKARELRPQIRKRGHLDVRLFGHLDVALDGDPFRLATPRKSLQVLAYLLLHRAAPVSREYLAFLLFPDDEEGVARTRLRSTLSELQKILPQPASEYVIVDAEKLAWNPEADIWLDVDAFAEASQDPRRCGEAIDLYRGDLLPEVYDEWLDGIRELHRNAYLRCLTERVSQARRDADLALAIETARRILTVDPWREDIVRRIVAMRYESGDRAGALAEYGAFAKRLRAEMHADPMPETKAVAERISRGQAPPDEESAVELSSNAGSAALPFVGRRDEMERLLGTWSRAARGHGACAFVGGEPGIGKSRLALEFAHAVEDRGGRVLIGATSSPEAVPYESVVDALRSALPLVAELKPTVALASVAALLPEIHARVALPALPQLDAPSERIRLFESLFRCLTDLAAPRPLLLVLEDLHWAQAATLELLQFLLRRIPGAPVMVVATYRDEESPHLHALHQLRREVRATAGAQSLWLSRLSVSDIEELRAHVDDVRDRPAEALLATSQGNPFFLTQLVVELREGERAAAPPASLEAAVSRRIERLSDHARTAAEIAACIGDRFSRDVVREVSAWEEATLNDALDELLDRRIIREAGRGILEYAFTHHLVYEAILRAVSPSDAAVRRRRIARVLERLYPERVSELSAALAAHYEAAGDLANAARCYLEAARRSIAIGALAEARMHCERALALEVDARVRAELLLERAVIESRQGDSTSWDAALTALERVDELLGDPVVHRSSLLRRMEFAVAMGNAAMHDQAARALRTLIPEEDLAWRAALDLSEAKMASVLGDLTESYAAGEAALARSRAAGDEAGATRALCALLQVEAHRGHLSAAQELFEEAMRVAARAGDPVLELLAANSGWVVMYQRRDVQRCRTLASRCLDLAVKVGDRAAEAQAHGQLGVALSVTGSGAEYRAAREHYACAARICRETGNPIGSAVLLNEAMLEMKLGFFERAERSTKEATELFERAKHERGHIGGLNNLVFLRACTGDFAGARRAGELGLKLARAHGFGVLEASILENLAFAEGSARNYARAIELAEASFAQRSKSESEVWSSKTLADVAIWHAALGNMPAARDAIARMLSDEDAIFRGTEWPAYCYWAAAQIYHLDGREADAARMLKRARQLMLETSNEMEAEDREQYLSIPWHRDILQASDAGLWPDPPR
jgi:DNA-binding SARP family transcriptional activator/tetratricopeptide (TPR) repeat protein